MGYRTGRSSDAHECESRHKIGAGEACKGVAASETILPNSNSAKPGACLGNQASALNHSNRPVRPRLTGGVGGGVTMTHPPSRYMPERGDHSWKPIHLSIALIKQRRRQVGRAGSKIDTSFGRMTQVKKIWPMNGPRARIPRDGPVLGSPERRRKRA